MLLKERFHFFHLVVLSSHRLAARIKRDNIVNIGGGNVGLRPIVGLQLGGLDYYISQKNRNVISDPWG